MSVIAPPPAAPPGPGPSLPPERRGMARDGVRLLAAGPAGITHHRFHRLPQLLCPGDLLVVNVSATIPAALDAVRDGLAHPCTWPASTTTAPGWWNRARPATPAPPATGAPGSACTCRAAWC
ncbi:MAG: S-adenosylmethionine:tRNA ribosyltransferase-isomerase [Thermoleophilia bacterium]